MDKTLKLFLFLIFSFPVNAQIVQQGIINTPSAGFAIAHDATANSGTTNCLYLDSCGGGAKTATFALTMSSNPHGFLWVNVIYGYGANNPSISSVTYAGSSLTADGVCFKLTINAYQVCPYYMVGPATGTNNIVVTMSNTVGAATYFFVTADSFTGVNQSTPFDGSRQTLQQSALSSVSVNITTTVVGDWVIDGLVTSDATGGGNAVAANSPQVQTQYLIGGEGGGQSYYPGPLNLGTYTDKWNNNQTLNWSLVVRAIQPG